MAVLIENKTKQVMMIIIFFLCFVPAQDDIAVGSKETTGGVNALSSFQHVITNYPDQSIRHNSRTTRPRAVGDTCRIWKAACPPMDPFIRSTKVTLFLEKKKQSYGFYYIFFLLSKEIKHNSNCTFVDCDAVGAAETKNA